MILVIQRIPLLMYGRRKQSSVQVIGLFLSITHCYFRKFGRFLGRMEPLPWRVSTLSGDTSWNSKIRKVRNRWWISQSHDFFLWFNRIPLLMFDGQRQSWIHVIGLFLRSTRCYFRNFWGFPGRMGPLPWTVSALSRDIWWNSKVNIWNGDDELANPMILFCDSIGFPYWSVTDEKSARTWHWIVSQDFSLLNHRCWTFSRKDVSVVLKAKVSALNGDAF